MNIIDYFSLPVFTRLAVSMVHFLWQGAVIALGAMLLANLGGHKRAQRRYTIYLGSMGVMVLAAMVTFWLIEMPGLNGSTVQEWEAAVSQPPPSSMSEGMAGSRSLMSNIGVAGYSDAPLVQDGDEVAVAAGSVKFNWNDYVPYAVAGYGAGVLILLVRLLVGLQGGQRLRRCSAPIRDKKVLAVLDHQMRVMGMAFRPALACCERVVVPTVVGLLRPTILLPFSLATGLKLEQVEMILAHELAHIRRYDLLFNVLQKIVEAVLFFHPAVWLISRKVRIEREHCCDDLVVQGGGEVMAYATSLVEMAEQGLRRKFTSPVAAEGLGAMDRPSHLRGRVLRLLGYRQDEGVRLRRPWLITSVVVMVLLSFFAFFPTNREALSRESEQDMAVQTRVRELVYVLRNYALDVEVEKWTAALKELIEIGSPAAPELVMELDRTERDLTMRAIGFVLRGIGDPRAVPGLIRALPKTHVRSSDMGLSVHNWDLWEFMVAYDKDEIDDPYPLFSYGRAINEISEALIKITGHADEIDNRRGASSYDPTAVRAVQLERQQTAERWEQWWSAHREEFLTADQLLPEKISRGRGDLVDLAGWARYGPPIPSGERVRLGPVQELAAAPYTQDCWDAAKYVDFDMGRVLTELEGGRPGPEGERNIYDIWYEKAGIDGRVKHWAGAAGEGLDLEGEESYVWQVDNLRWDRFEYEITNTPTMYLGPPRSSSDFRPLVLESEGIRKVRGEYPATFIFKTREGGAGMVQIMGYDDNLSGLQMRYRMIVNEEQAAREPQIDMNRARRFADVGSSFGPPMEAFIQAPRRGALASVDLDTGTGFEHPKNFSLARSMIDEYYLWHESVGADLTCRVDSRNRLNTLTGVGMKLMEVSNPAWDTMTPAVAAEFLDREVIRQETILLLTDSYAVLGGAISADVMQNLQVRQRGLRMRTALFQTREGGMGMLQITGYSNAPLGLDVRFKLIQRDNQVGTTTIGEQIGQKQDKDQTVQQRVRELIYVLRMSVRGVQGDSWISAIMELTEIGKAAVPELVAELDRMDKPRFCIIFTLRAIGDPRAVPGLIRAIPKTTPRSGSASCPIYDRELHEFMALHDLGNQSYPRYSISSSIQEIAATLEKMTGHNEGDDYIKWASSSTGRPARAKMLERQRAAQRWEAWWGKHGEEFLTPEELASAEIGPRAGDPVGAAGLARFGAMIPSGKGIRLGPIIERTIPYGQRLWDVPKYIDFDTGRLLTLFEGGRPAPEGGEQELGVWIGRAGVDGIIGLSVDPAKGPVCKLEGADTYVWQVENMRWDTFGVEVQRDHPIPLGRPTGSNFIARNPLNLNEDVFARMPVTFLFTTREGGAGIVQLLRSINDPPALQLRFRMIEQEGRQVQHPVIDTERRVAALGAGKVFSPVIDTALRVHDGLQNSVLDLDMGNLLTQPMMFTVNPPEPRFIQWLRQTGGDLHCDTYSEYRIGWLEGDNMVLLEVRNEAWLGLTPGQVAEYLTREEVNEDPSLIIKQRAFTAPPSVTRYIKDELPKTALFKTREGGRGILQVMDFADGYLGAVRICYKLIK